MTVSTNPTWKYSAITPSDNPSANFPGDEVARAIYIGDISGGADIVVADVQGNVTTFKGVIAGTWLPLRFVRVNATGTTATELVALF